MTLLEHSKIISNPVPSSMLYDNTKIRLRCKAKQIRSSQGRSQPTEQIINNCSMRAPIPECFSACQGNFSRLHCNQEPRVHERLVWEPIFRDLNVRILDCSGLG
jgi:hypothetical protein